MNQSIPPDLPAAYGGPGWSPRQQTLAEEIGSIWGACGLDREWTPLKSVLLQPPSPVIGSMGDPDVLHFLAPVNHERAAQQHRSLAEAYRQSGIQVHNIDPPGTPPPNLMFAADLFFMTPEGVILGRPASTVRAGEERWVARRLAALGVPILLSVHGHGTFEGADAAWLNPGTVLLATGLRTNPQGADQVERLLQGLGVEVIRIHLPPGTMHLMGILRFADRDLAVGWPGRLSPLAREALQRHGYTLIELPDENEAMDGHALNFVTLGPRRILMADGNPGSRAFYEEQGIQCQVISVDELLKAAGGIGCLTGVLQRQREAE